MRTRQISGRPRPAARQRGGQKQVTADGITALVPLRGLGAYRSWRRLHRWLVVILLSTVGGGMARAQGGGSPSTVSGASAAASAAMTGDLRRLVSANEVYRAKTKRYAAAVGALTGFRPSAGVSVSVLTASATGWAGKATAASLPGKSCVVSVGVVPTPPKTDATGRSAPDAVVVCDPA